MSKQPEYVSPFELPPTKIKCTSSWDHRYYPYNHAMAGESGTSREWGKKCPVHNHALKETRAAWQQWSDWRERYAALSPLNNPEEMQSALETMLSYVTPDNPPDRKSKEMPRAWIIPTAAAIALIIILVAILVDL